MNREVTSNVIRFFSLVLVQVLVLRGLDIREGGFSYTSVLIYPLFLMLLPVRTPPALMVLLGFLIGLSVDVFYESLGVHAGASVLTAYLRSFVLSFLEPRGGYKVSASPNMNRYGLGFFFPYSAILMFFHLLAYFSLEIFTPYYFAEIFVRTMASFFVSMIFIILLQFLSLGLANNNR